MLIITKNLPHTLLVKACTLLTTNVQCLIKHFYRTHQVYLHVRKSVY